MKYRFITIIHNLQLEKPECRIPLDSGMISNKHSLLKDTLGYHNKLALDTLGVHSIDEFDGRTFYLLDGSFESQLTQQDIDLFGTQLTFAFLQQIQAVARMLWLIRDNRIYVRDGFLFVYDNEVADGTTFKASLGTINTFASLGLGDTFFTKEEIQESAKDMLIIPVSDVRAGKQNYGEATQFQYFKDAKMGRKTYAWIYISFARSASAIPVKILMYVTAMEALVSTASSELSHQVSERVAILLGETVEERKEIYATVKKAYGLRSKAAHGEALKGKVEDTTPLLIQLDEYLRQMMHLEAPFEMEPQKIDEFFLDNLMKEKLQVF